MRIETQEETHIRITKNTIEMFWKDLDLAESDRERAHVCRCLHKLYREIGAY